MLLAEKNNTNEVLMTLLPKAYVVEVESDENFIPLARIGFYVALWRHFEADCGASVGYVWVIWYFGVR